MKNKSFAVFILTHGRPDNVLTYKTLKKCNYTGKIYFILDDEDLTIDRYIENFGIENIIVFDKKTMADNMDEANNFNNRKVIVHARNFTFKIAKKLGIKHFLQLDDDYYEINYKYLDIKGSKMPKNIDKIFDLMITYLKSIPALSVAFAQMGDFIGGIDNGKGLYRFSKRKCMNSFFCSTDKYFQFLGSINEDVNTYTTLGSRGDILFTFTNIQLEQKDTQTNAGGMTDEYAITGTYVKSFHSVIMQPSSVKASIMNANYNRIHHSINWKNTTPMILDEKYKEKRRSI